jgi:hypothetical protein
LPLPRSHGQKRAQSRRGCPWPSSAVTTTNAKLIAIEKTFFLNWALHLCNRAFLGQQGNGFWGSQCNIQTLFFFFFDPPVCALKKHSSTWSTYWLDNQEQVQPREKRSQLRGSNRR